MRVETFNTPVKEMYASEFYALMVSTIKLDKSVKLCIFTRESLDYPNGVSIDSATPAFDLFGFQRDINRTINNTGVCVIAALDDLADFSEEFTVYVVVGD